MGGAVQDPSGEPRAGFELRCEGAIPALLPFPSHSTPPTVSRRRLSDKWEDMYRSLCALLLLRVKRLNLPTQEGDAFGSPHLGTGKILGEEVAAGKPIVRKWLKLYHRRTKQAANFGKARICVSVDFSPVGSVRVSRACACACLKHDHGVGEAKGNDWQTAAP